MRRFKVNRSSVQIQEAQKQTNMKDGDRQLSSLHTRRVLLLLFLEGVACLFVDNTALAMVKAQESKHESGQ